MHIRALPGDDDFVAAAVRLLHHHGLWLGEGIPAPFPPSTVMRISLSPVEDWDLGISAATASSTATSASMPAMIAIFRFPVVRSASFPRKRTALFRKEAP